MSVVPTDLPTRADLGRATSYGASPSMKWAALQDAARVVSTLAGMQPERPTPAIRNFAAQIRDLDPERRTLAERGIDDLTAIMQPGIAALLAVLARGADPQPAGLALYREFHRARGALLALVPATGQHGPRRSA